MKELLFKGSACAIVTPFKGPEKDVDLSKYEELIRFQIENGTQAIVACGTTGEAATLSYYERKQCAACAVRMAKGKVPIIMGTGANNTQAAVRLSNDAEKEGVDGLLIVTPFYNKTSQDGIIAHYSYISEHVSTPMIVYNVPSRTGLDIKPETYKELAKIKNIVAVKEANGNISSAAKTMALCGDTIAVYAGNDDQTVPFMSLGAHGVISVAANVIPRTMQTLVQLCLDGNFTRAAHLQQELCELEDCLFRDVNPIPVKTLMEYMHLCESSVRLPLVKCNAQLREKLQQLAMQMPKDQ